MAINKNTRPVVELDFDQIKADIIAFIKNDPTFTDYNFEGSALNTIADMLAYNTFNNAYYANMLHAEGFLDSAQKRASVVSRAKELGYTPVSATCSTAFVDVQITTQTPQIVPYYILRGDTFSASNDSGQFTFSVVDSVPATVDGVKQTMLGVKLVNGTNVKNTFIVDTQRNPRQMFSIPNKLVDVSTLKVYIKDSISAVEREEYTRAIDLYSLVPSSKIYFLQESYDGYYQIYFGSDIFGIQPPNGKVIEIDYFVGSNTSSADNCSQFSYNGQFLSSVGTEVTTTQPSIGGSDKEDIDSIKFNAKRANAAKSRIITKNDYALEIATQFPFIKSASVWGGEENTPPIYGKVFVSLQPVTGYILSPEVKTNTIIPALRKKSMMTIIPEIVDPYYTFIEFASKVKFNPNKTSTTMQNMELGVANIVKSYVEQISKFDADYLEPELIGMIMQSDSGIVSVDMVKRFGFNISPALNVETKFSFLLNNPVVGGSVYQTKFEIDNNGKKEIVYISDVVSSDIIRPLGVFNTSGALVKTVGTINMNTGQSDLIIKVSEFFYNSKHIEVRMTPFNDDIIVKRNQILTLDTTKTANNLVTTELYAK